MRAFSPITASAFVCGASFFRRVFLNIMRENTIKSAEHNKWLKERIQAIRKNVLSGQNLATAMRNSDYDFPSKICINKLLLNSEREDSVSAMNTYAGQWLEDAKNSVRKSGLIITGISGGFVFFFILNMISAIYSISDMLKQ